MNDDDAVRPAPSSAPHGFFGFAVLSPYILIDDLSALNELVETLQEHIERRARTFLRQLDEAVAARNLSTREADEFYGAHSEDYHRHQEWFPTAVRYSNFVSSCTLFESGLTELCLDLEADDFELEETWANCNRRGIYRCARFLRQNFGLHPNRGALWNTLRDFFQIRHCVAHADGNVELMSNQNRPNVERAVECQQHLGVSIVGTRLEMNSEFCGHVIRSMRSFLNELVDALRMNATIGPRYWP